MKKYFINVLKSSWNMLEYAIKNGIFHLKKLNDFALTLTTSLKIKPMIILCPPQTHKTFV